MPARDGWGSRVKVSPSSWLMVAMPPWPTRIRVPLSVLRPPSRLCRGPGLQGLPGLAAIPGAIHGTAQAVGEYAATDGIDQHAEKAALVTGFQRLPALAIAAGAKTVPHSDAR